MELSTDLEHHVVQTVPSEVSPMYMPGGRLRTASSPFRTLMLSDRTGPAGIVLFCFRHLFSLVQIRHRHHEVFEIVESGQGKQRRSNWHRPTATRPRNVEIVEPSTR